MFKINPETGEVRTVKGLDYEIQRMHFLTISTEEARGTFNLGMCLMFFCKELFLGKHSALLFLT